MGDSRYIGGQTRHFRSGLVVRRLSILAKKSRKMGSTRRDTLEAPSTLVKKLVTQEKMQMVASALICLMASVSTSRRPHCRTWALDIRGRSRQLMGFMCLFTFESPMIVNIIAIAKIRRKNVLEKSFCCARLKVSVLKVSVLK